MEHDERIFCQGRINADTLSRLTDLEQACSEHRRSYFL
ncbi:hypothetical protein ACCUM_1529 [Candidatus Accumulibacter phosphatis]|uniref:Uncharacterized protein n=1 Tax=Candidatus Accumulibacter phosphatis TaxID=327160 RepID=A0A5S4EJ62_9PROT|nr:hypothetical protein ACCUM_1529 [Candidatus Accumulibacter phosphatis]